MFSWKVFVSNFREELHFARVELCVVRNLHTAYAIHHYINSDSDKANGGGWIIVLMQCVRCTKSFLVRWTTLAVLGLNRKEIGDELMSKFSFIIGVSIQIENGENLRMDVDLRAEEDSALIQPQDVFQILYKISKNSNFSVQLIASLVHNRKDMQDLSRCDGGV